MPLLAWVGIAIVASLFVSAIVMKRPPAANATTLDDFDVPQIQDGTPHAVVFGEGWIEGWQVLWYGNYRTSKIKMKGGKK